MKILAFAASLRKNSLNKKLLNLAVGFIPPNVAEVQKIDLEGFPLPPYDQDLETSNQFPQNAKQLGQFVTESQAILVSTPEYNHSMPGHFKNTFDWVSRLRPLPWHKKSVLLISASPGLMGGGRGILSLRVPFEACGCYVYPEMFSLSSADQAFAENGQLKDLKLEERLQTTVKSFLDFSKKLS